MAIVYTEEDQKGFDHKTEQILDFLNNQYGNPTDIHIVDHRYDTTEVRWQNIDNTIVLLSLNPNSSNLGYHYITAVSNNVMGKVLQKFPDMYEIYFKKW